MPLQHTGQPDLRLTGRLWPGVGGGILRQMDGRRLRIRMPCQGLAYVAGPCGWVGVWGLKMRLKGCSSWAEHPSLGQGQPGWHLGYGRQDSWEMGWEPRAWGCGGWQVQEDGRECRCPAVGLHPPHSLQSGPPRGSTNDTLLAFLPSSEDTRMWQGPCTYLHVPERPQGSGSPSSRHRCEATATEAPWKW